jgi:RNA polymerase sigma-70 factor (ECF subfamily)
VSHSPGRFLDEAVSLVLIHPVVTPDADDSVAIVPPLLNDAQGVPDAVLAKYVRTGDHDAFKVLFDRYAARLVDFAIGLLHDRETAQDVVADVYFAIWRRRSEWIPDRVSTYLFAAVRNRCHTYRTSAHARHEVELSEMADDELSGNADPAPSVSELMDEAELYARVQQVLETLPPQRKTAAILRWREGMSFSEIAHIMDISENAARLQVSRALKVVRAVFDVSPG